MDQPLRLLVMAAIVADDEPRPTVVPDVDAAISVLWNSLQSDSPDANAAIGVAFPGV